MSDEHSFRVSSTCWTSRKNSDEITVYETVSGRPSVADLLAHLQEVAPHAPLDEIGINYATVKWTRPATPEEQAKRAEQERKHDERHEQWEKETYERLKAKYG